MTRRLVFGITAVIVLTGLLQGAAPSAQNQRMPDMKMHEQMMADMAAANERLAALVWDMEMATGDAKVTATAAVVAELVRQHRSMQERMGQMHQHMMSGHGGMKTR